MEFYELLEVFMPLLCMHTIVFTLTAIFKLMQRLERGARTTDIAEELEKRLDEQIREEEERNYIDDDLKKYFNYKE